MERRFWNNAHYVEDWLNNIQNFEYKFSAKTIGKGNRGIYLYILNVNSEEDIKLFLEKYQFGESRFAKFYLTPSNITHGNPFYVSIVKKK